MRIAVLVVLLAGCSIGVRAPRSATEPNDCTQSYVPPIIDATLAAALATAAVQEDSDMMSGVEKYAFGTFAVIAAVSSVSGFRDVHACKRVMQRESLAVDSAALRPGDPAGERGDQGEDGGERALERTLRGRLDGERTDLRQIGTHGAELDDDGGLDGNDGAGEGAGPDLEARAIGPIVDDEHDRRGR